MLDVFAVESENLVTYKIMDFGFIGTRYISVKNISLWILYFLKPLGIMLIN